MPVLLARPGSQTLHHWQQLAQPNLGTILDPRPGVITKGFTQMPKDVVYHISDLEEDEEEGITFQVQQQPLQVEPKPAAPTPVTGIFLPPITSAGGPVTGEESAPRNQCTAGVCCGYRAAPPPHPPPRAISDMYSPVQVR